MDLRLRPYQLSDQSALAALANNPQVSANLKDIFPYPYTPQDAQNYLNFITYSNMLLLSTDYSQEQFLLLLVKTFIAT